MKIRDMVTGIVGSKGELFPPKKIRKGLGMEPGSTVSYYIDRGRLIVHPLPTLDGLLAREPKVIIEPEEFQAVRKDLSRSLEKGR